MMRTRAGRRRPPRRRRSPWRAVALTAAGALVAGGLAVGGWALLAGDPDGGAAVVSISCPDVANSLRDVPQSARAAVDLNQATLDVQVANAFDQLQQAQTTGTEGSADRILAALERQRQQTLGAMSAALGQAAAPRDGLQDMAGCTLKKEAADSTGQPVSALAGRNGQGQSAAQGNGLSRRDFADITRTAPNTERPRPRAGASTGSFVSVCGRNENGHFNSDNVIVAPGVSNGAHHMHDYVGNLSTDAQSDNRSLQSSGTTCTNNDQSTYYWPVLRQLDGSRERDAAAPGGGRDKNVGRILTPTSVTLRYDGSPVAQVVPMQRFMRLITGDAKAFTSGQDDARASWSCTGFEDRQLKTKYPICPAGRQVVRTLAFPDCWDGRNTDSANHRTHVAFAGSDGRCGKKFVAIPRLTMRLTYNVAPNSFFAIDSFPEQRHKPVTDHGDFINVMSRQLADQAAGCINSGRRCGG